MMQYKDLEQAFQAKIFSIEDYTPAVIASHEIRSQLIQNLLRDTHINVYYRSYYLIDAVSKSHPDLFYAYWDQLASLRDHPNSYHRNIYHWVLTNLIPIDRERKFDAIKEAYFTQIKDVKMLTGIEAVKDIIKISFYRPDLEEEIIKLFLDESMIAGYTDKQKDRFRYFMLTYFETVLDKRSDERLLKFAEMCTHAKNTTTSKLAKRIMKKQRQDKNVDLNDKNIR